MMKGLTEQGQIAVPTWTSKYAEQWSCSIKLWALDCPLRTLEFQVLGGHCTSSNLLNEHY